MQARDRNSDGSDLCLNQPYPAPAGIMKISEPTEDHAGKSNADFDLPWPRFTMIPRTLHTNTPFFRDLLIDLKTFGKFLNLDGICNLVSELLECAEDCQCGQRSNDNENGVGLDGNSSAGMLGAGTLFVLVLVDRGILCSWNDYT